MFSHPIVPLSNKTKNARLLAVCHNNTVRREAKHINGLVTGFRCIRAPRLIDMDIRGRETPAVTS